MIGGFPGCDSWKKSKPGGAPPKWNKWVIIPLTMDISPMNHLVTLDLLALGHHPVRYEKQLYLVWPPTGIFSRVLSGIIWHSIWHFAWHSIWYIFWHLTWLSIWHFVCILSYLVVYLTHTVRYFFYIWADIWLVVYLPLWKILANGKDDNPYIYIMEKKHVWNHQPVLISHWITINSIKAL